jgi:uncharacterized protein (TIGR03437 family)
MRDRILKAALFIGCAGIGLAQDVRVGIFHGRPVTYEVQGPYAVIEGDILMGTVEDVEAAARSLHPQSAIYSPPNPSAIRWPNGTMAYVIDPALPNQQRVLDAIQHWNSRTPLHVVPRTNEANYVRFASATLDAACESFVGMKGGVQDLLVTDGCTSGNLIHEIGHAFGLLHEQVRMDRNAYVTVLYENVDKRFRNNFDQSPFVTTDSGYYDYDSIMHYFPTAFSRNGLDTLESVPVGIPIGQTIALSAGDIDAVSRLYGIVPSTTTITTVPSGLQITVDGETTISPHSYSWASGSVHTVSVNPSQGTDPRYAFVRWTDNGEAAHSVTVSQDATAICAVFAVQHKVTSVAASGSGTVSVTPSSSDGFYAERTQVRLDVAPAAGSEFVQWLGNFNALLNFLENGYGFSSPVSLLDVNEPGQEYQARFSTSAVTTIDSQPTGRMVLIDGMKYVTPARFVWASGSSHTLSVASTVQMSGNNTRRFQFQNWDGGSGTDVTLVAGSDSATHVAAFNMQYLLTTTHAGSGQVLAAPVSADGFYDAGTAVQLTAQPQAGSTLQYWLGDTVGGSLSQTVTMSEDRVAIAVFGVALPFVIVNSATVTGNPVFDNTGFAVAPGEIVSLYGTNIGPSDPALGQIVNEKLITNISATRVLFDGQPAPLLYVASDVINAVVPATVGSTSNTTLIQVERNGVIRSGLIISAVGTLPGLYTADTSGRGQIAALNEDYSYNSPSRPAEAGSIMVLFATGAGLGDQDVPDGQIMGATAVHPKGPVYVRVGKLPAEVLYAGSVATLVNGAMQINVRLPKDLIGGPATPIQLIVGNYSSPVGATIAVK